MALEQRSRIREPQGRVLDLPPPFRLVVLREVGDAFAHACAKAPELGAGTMVFVGRFDLAEFAVILEPDEPLAGARRVVFYACMVALADALAALAPPEKPIAVVWPDAIEVDGGLVGGGRLGWPQGAKDRVRPDWLVFGAAIRTVAMSGEEAGLHPLATALEQEGFGDVNAGRLVEGFARHLMIAIDQWQESGFEPIAHQYLLKMARAPETRRSIDPEGDLREWRTGRAAERRRLVPALKTPSWLDPESGGPRW